MEILNNLVVSFNDFLWGYILIILLIGAGLLFSFKTKFVQFRYIKEMFRLLGDGIGRVVVTYESLFESAGIKIGRAHV